MAKYKTCPKCGERHSELVRHTCPTRKTKRAKTECEVTEHDIHEGTAGIDTSTAGGAKQDRTEGEAEGREGEGEAEAEGEGGTEGEGQGETEGDGDGDGEAKTKGEGGEQREGEGEAGEGEASEGEGEAGEGEGEGMPEAQLPEPETPPVAVVVTVLKFAALCAQSAENGMIVVEVTEPGLLIYGHDGDERTASETIGWGEFEKRSTLDGEFMVRDAVKAVDAALIEGEATVATWRDLLPWDRVEFCGDRSHVIEFADGTPAAAWDDNGDGTYAVGVEAGYGGFHPEHGDWGSLYGENPLAQRLAALVLGEAYSWALNVDRFGFAVKDPTLQVVKAKD
jgi:hypothetical protein